jgi:hypothetical protein
MYTSGNGMPERLHRDEKATYPFSCVKAGWSTTQRHRMNKSFHTEELGGNNKLVTPVLN